MSVLLVCDREREREREREGEREITPANSKAIKSMTTLVEILFLDQNVSDSKKQINEKKSFETKRSPFWKPQTYGKCFGVRIVLR